MLRELADRTRQKQKLNSSIPSMPWAHCTEVMAKSWTWVRGNWWGLFMPIFHWSANLQISQEKPCVPQLSSTPFHLAQSVTDGRSLIKFLALSTLELKPCLSRPSYMSFPPFRACQPLVLVPALQVTPASPRELQFGSKEISSLGEAVGISASLVRHSSALFSSANNILLKNPAHSDLRSGNFFK